MSKGYWIVRVDVTDQEQFKKYAAANADASKKYGAKFLVLAGQFTVVEGATRTKYNCRISVLPGRPRLLELS